MSTKGMAEMGLDAKGENENMECRYCVYCKHKLSTAMRCTMFVAVICSVMFVITLCSCSLSWYFYIQFQDFRRELDTLIEAHTMSDEIVNVLHSQQQHQGTFDSDKVINRYERKAEQKNKGRKDRQDSDRERRRRRKDRKSCRCKKLSDQQKSEVTGMITEQLKSTNYEQLIQQMKDIQTIDVQKKEQFSFISAAHYTTFVDNDFISDTIGEADPGNLENTVMHKHIGKWQGTLYRNRSFISEAAPLTFKFFKEADWMETLTTDRLFDYNSDTGKFQVRHTALYHLYAHVLFYDLKTRMAIGIMHESGSDLTTGRKENNSIVFRCMESTDFIDSVEQNSKFKSCNVNGVLYLRQGDFVSLQSLYSNTCIDLTSDATYFGAVLFSSNEL